MKLCYLNWKWVESDRHFACYQYIWTTEQIMISEMKRSGQGQIFHLLLIYLKHSEEKNTYFIKLRYLKWKGVDRVREIYALGLNWTTDFSWFSWSKILSFDGSVSLKLYSDWLVNLLKELFQEWHKQTNRQSDMIDCWTAYFCS